MIDLTPLEVRQKKGDFRRGLRGYDPELVNDFLDLVADRMEELVKENLSLRDAVESVREEVAAYRKKEQALSEALMTAQKLGEDARGHATRESDLILREARAEAESVREEAARQLMREEEALRNVRARRHQLVESFRRMLERELSELEVIQETLDLDAEARSHRTDRAGPGLSEKPRAGAPDHGPAASRSVDPESQGDQTPAQSTTDTPPVAPIEALEDAAERLLEELHHTAPPARPSPPAGRDRDAPVGGSDTGDAAGGGSEAGGSESSGTEAAGSEAPDSEAGRSEAGGGVDKEDISDWLASLIEEEGEESSRQ
jgi:cell division initiation protein